MTRKQAFKYGFATKIAELGLSPSEFEALTMSKQAAGDADGVGGEVADTATDLMKALLIGGALAVPALGFGAGYSLAGSNAASQSDIDTMKSEYIANEYERAVREMLQDRQRQLALRGRRAPTTAY